MAGDAMGANVDRSERRGSLGRALERLRAVMRRRGLSRRDVPALASTEGSVEEAEVVQDKHCPSAGIVPTVTGDTAMMMRSIPRNAPIPPISIAFDDTNAEEHDVPLLPMPSSRTCISEEQARVLFEKHGLVYQPRRRSNEEPAAKIRRVEKPIRLRVHWRCHQCHGHFSRERTCMGCGHHRCGDCTRSPGQRVQEILDYGKLAKEHDDQQPAGPSGMAASTDDKSITGEVPPFKPLEKDDTSTDEDAEDAARSYQYLLTARPKRAEQLIPRPKAQIIRRQCHKCETQFLPPSRTDCENCSHTRCNLCPRWPPKPEKWADGSPGDRQAPEEEVRMVRAVQRVYRKPRQRVRYTCDQCQAVFVDKHACQTCGHAKCDRCVRNPPKKLAPTYDPDMVQAVSDRLAAYGRLQQPSPEVVAAAS